MELLLLKIHNVVAAVAPIHGINSDGTNDASKWTILFQPSATDDERAAAHAALLAFDVAAELARADVPQEVWAGAMMRALNTLGILEQIDGIVAASGDLLTKKLWDRAAAFRRDDPMIAAVGATAGWSESDLDDLFRLAGSFNS